MATTPGAAAPRRRRAAMLAIGLMALLGAGAAYWYWTRPAETGGARSSAARPVPVNVAIAARQNTPIYLTGLGTVQASFTIAIHAQVDGIMQKVLFTEGQHVKSGDVLAKIDPRLYQAAFDQAKAKKMMDEAQLISAQKDLFRARTLVGKSFETQQTVDQQQAKVDQLIASIDADEALMESAQTNLDFTEIKAPSDGRVGVRLVDPGNLVHAADTRPIASLVLTQPSAVLFTLPAQVLDDLRDAMARGPVEVAAYDQNDKRLLSTGQLLLIDNAIDQATATIRLKAMFDNKDDRLWPGEFVNARVLVATRENVIAVPTTAIQRGPKGLFVWIVNADDIAETRPIEIGPASGNLTVIENGLSDGERVVTDGQYKLQVNARVTVIPPTTASAATTGTATAAAMPAAGAPK